MQSRLVVVPLDGSGAQVVATGLFMEPAWSPDGTSIAYLTEMPDGLSHLYVVHADGTERKQLTRGNVRDVLPEWRPRLR